MTSKVEGEGERTPVGHRDQKACAFAVSIGDLETKHPGLYTPPRDSLTSAGSFLLPNLSCVTVVRGSQADLGMNTWRQDLSPTLFTELWLSVEPFQKAG